MTHLKRTWSKGFISVLTMGLVCSSFGNAHGSTAHESSLENQEEKRVSVRGTVVTTAGEALAGVSVTVPGTTIGTLTGTDGGYQISAPARSMLTFTYYGYLSVNKIVANQSVVNVTMEEDAKLIDQVVVVGYGMQKAVNLTGAVASVNVKKTLDSRPIADVGRDLQGVIPGVSIVVPSGEIGSDATIKIRGQVGSQYGKSDPLILMDNVEIPSLSLINPADIESISVLKDAAASSIYGAKAAFGVVLITTKKGASTESVSVSYSNNFAWSKVAKDINMAGLEGLEYSLAAIERINESEMGAFIKLSRNSYEKSVAYANKYGSMGAKDPVVYGRDWYAIADPDPKKAPKKYGIRLYDAYDFMIRDWAPTNTHNISVSGKSKSTSYYVGLGYFGQNGLLKNVKKDKFDRYNVSAKLSADLTKFFTLRTGFLFSQNTKYYPYSTGGYGTQTGNDPWLYLFRWGPLQPMGTDEYGNLLRSPASEMHMANIGTRQTSFTNVNLGGTVNFTKDWDLQVDYTFTKRSLTGNNPGQTFTMADTWAAPAPVLDANGAPTYVNDEGKSVDKNTPGAIQAYRMPLRNYDGVGPDETSQIRRSTEDEQRHTINAFSTYKLNVNDIHSFIFMAGVNATSSITRSVWGNQTGLLDFKNPQFGTTVGTQTTGGNVFWESQIGFFARVNYALYDRYLFEANLRYDGSSKFPKGLQWRWFPSFSVGWRASEEKFMKWAKPVLSSLKFRGSYGEIGDQSVRNDLYVPTLVRNPASAWIGSNGVRNLHIGTPVPVDANITWQNIRTLNIGVDLLLWDRLGVTFDWYNRTTDKMIIDGSPLPITFGGPSPKGNYGQLQTKGWELSINYSHRFRNGLNISGMASLSDASTYVTGYFDDVRKSIAPTAWWKGKHYGDIYGFRVDRLYQKEDFVTDANGDFVFTYANNIKMHQLAGDNPVYQSEMQGKNKPANFFYGPGDVKYKDLDGDGMITYGKETDDNRGDLDIIGNTTPRYSYAFRVGADWKGFDFQIFFQGVGKREVWGDGSLAIPGYNVSDGAMPETFAKDFWRPNRTDAFYPRPFNVGATAGGVTNKANTHVSDRYLLNMAYLRLKNVTLGYSLPQKVISKIYLSQVRVYVSLENIVTWDKLRGLPIDPEEVAGISLWSSAGTYNSNRTGVGAPMLKNISFGVQLTF